MAEPLHKYETLLREVLEDERLTEDELGAFADMLEGIYIRGLSAKQRSWINAVADRLDIYRSTVGDDRKQGYGGPYAVGKAEKVTLPWEKDGYQKPMKPPGRR